MFRHHPHENLKQALAELRSVSAQRWQIEKRYIEALEKVSREMSKADDLVTAVLTENQQLQAQIAANADNTLSPASMAALEAAQPAAPATPTTASAATTTAAPPATAPDQAAAQPAAAPATPAVPST